MDYDILKEPTIYKTNVQSSESFEDFMKNFLSLIGYKNFEYITDIAFDTKKRMMMYVAIKAMCEISRIGTYVDSFKENPLFNYGYHTVINGYIGTFGKYFYFHKPPNELYQIFDKIIKENKNSILNGDGENMINILYNLLQPYLGKPKSLILKTPEVVHVCDFCGSRYDYNKLSNCPSCGA